MDAHQTRVLVIEDEPAIAENVVYALSTEGFAPVWARTAAAGLAELSAGGIALVLLDIGLPDGNGLELARRLRREGDVPIIFVTARASEIDRVVGLEIGADDYVVKPFSPRELTARVKAVLRRLRPAPAPEVSAPLRYGPFSVDEARMRVHFVGVPVDLSRLEYRLLVLLIRHPGQVFSRERLMDLAWDGATASGDRTVDSHMKLLRRKLRAVDPDADPIVTHRGTGYSLKEFR